VQDAPDSHDMSVKRPTTRAGRRIGDERGQALVEFAVLLPVLLLLLVGIIEIGSWFWTDIDLTSGTREGGRLLAASKNDASAIQDVEARLVQNLDSEIDTSKLQYTFSPPPAITTPLWPSGTTVTMTVTYPDELTVLGISASNPNMTTSAQVRIQ
jgi:Flp pilus assembly protein TadG